MEKTGRWKMGKGREVMVIPEFILVSANSKDITDIKSDSTSGWLLPVFHFLARILLNVSREIPR